MSKKQAGERKRTVTITLGPETWLIVQKLQDRIGKDKPGMRLEITTICSVALLLGLGEYNAMYDIVPVDGWNSVHV